MHRKTFQLKTKKKKEKKIFSLPTTIPLTYAREKAKKHKSKENLEEKNSTPSYEEFLATCSMYGMKKIK